MPALPRETWLRGRGRRAGLRKRASERRHAQHPRPDARPRPQRPTKAQSPQVLSTSVFSYCTEQHWLGLGSRSPSDRAN
eukprot:4238970-Prymnesium_polylepis.1